jgi:hypothetical protein
MEVPAMTDIIPQGHTITFTEDRAFPGNWFADLRDDQGRVRESGQGAGQAAARTDLLARVERAEREQPAPAPVDTRLPTFAGHVAALLGAGYEVAFTPGGAHGVAAHVEKPGDPEAGCTALGATAAAALWAASPLHDGVPFTVTDEGSRDAGLDNLDDRLSAVEGKLEDLGDDRDTLRLSWRVIADLVRVRIPDGFTARLGDTPHLGKEAYASEVLAGCIADVEAEQLQRRAAAGHQGDGK